MRKVKQKLHVLHKCVKSPNAGSVPLVTPGPKPKIFRQTLFDFFQIRQTLLDFFQISFSHHPLPLQRAVSFRILGESAKRTQLPSEVAGNVEGYAIRQTLLDFFQITFSHHPLPLQRAVSFTILRESAKRTQLPSEVAGNVPSQIYM